MANGVMGFGSPPPPAQPSMYDRLMGGLLGPTPSYGGMVDEEARKAAQRQGLLALGTQLMAAGGPSPTRTSFGQALAPALMAGQQAQSQGIDQAMQAMLVKTKLQKKPAGSTPSAVQEYEYAKANGYKGTFEEWKRVASAQQQNPAAVQEYEYWKALPTKEEKDAYLTIKRSMQPYQIGEMAGGKVIFNKATGQFEQATTAGQEAAGAGQIAAGTAGGKVTGEATAEAKLDLPRLEQNTSQALETIGQLKSHPGLPYITGGYSMAPIVPGTPQAGADALAKQIQGKTFLEAFTTLKGSGQITEVEGTKAEAAIARLQRSQSRREYIKALNELEGVLNVGLERSRRKAGGGQEAQSGVKRVRVDANGDEL